MTEYIIQPVDDPPFVDCKQCNATGVRYVDRDPDYCPECAGDGEVPLDMTELVTLAHNLAIGAAMCRAHEQAIETLGGRPTDAMWCPGCGRSSL